MFVFSGWTLTGTFTYMTYTQGLTFLINIFFGPSVNAAQALAQQVNGSLNAFSANFMIATKPQIMQKAISMKCINLYFSAAKCLMPSWL